MSEGHSEGDLWGYSLEKFELLYKAALDRKGRDNAVLDYRNLQLTHAAIVACLSADGTKYFKQLLENLKTAGDLK